MKTLRKIFDLIVIGAMLAMLACGCSCERRASRLAERCPECFQQVTVPVHDTVVIPQKLITQTLPLSSLMEEQPVVFHQNDITLTVQLMGDSLAVEAAVDPDTVFLERTVTVPCPSPSVRSHAGPVQVLCASAFALLMLWGVLYEVKKGRKNNNDKRL